MNFYQGEPENMHKPADTAGPYKTDEAQSREKGKGQPFSEAVNLRWQATMPASSHRGKPVLLNPVALELLYPQKKGVVTSPTGQQPIAEIKHSYT